MQTTRTPRAQRSKINSIRELKNLLRITNGFATDEDIFSLAKKLYKGINTPVSLRCLQLLTAGDYIGLSKMSVKHEDYPNAEAFYLDYCAVSFLRKYSDFHFCDNKAEDPRELKAKETFYQAEKQCSETNKRFEPFNFGASAPPPLLRKILTEAQEIIKSCLGKKPPPPKTWPIRFGPGATSNATGEFVTIADKLIAYPECTLDAVRIVSGLRHHSPIWFDLIESVHPTCIYNKTSCIDDFGNEVVTQGNVAPRLVRGNRFTMVHKTAQTHRGIGIEPGSNVVWQLALGSLLNNGLKKLGIVKELQSEVNKKMALAASLGSGYCTIDLSSASDTVSYEVVKYLLPDRWFDTLASLRSPETYIDEKWVELEKFSSMGNGYTFELETLLFYALARATANVYNVKTEVHTYGDDIIIKGVLFKPLEMVLSFCGFTVNEQKSFVTGEFFESCGGDFLAGRDVRPYFCKGSPQNAVEWYSLVNGIRKMGSKHNYDGDLRPEFRSCWLGALQRVPRLLRIQGPIAIHDAWIHTTEEKFWDQRQRFGVTTNRALRVVPRKRPLHRYCELTARVSMLLGPCGDGLSLRGQLLRLGFIAGGISVS